MVVTDMVSANGWSSNRDMVLLTIITVTEDAMRNCPRAMREASLALGASQWQTIYKVVIPYSISGIK